MKVILYSPKSRVVREFKLKNLLYASLLPILFLIGILGVILNYVLFPSSNSLVAENKKLKSTISQLNEKINAIQNSLNSIYEMERKLKLATGIDYNDGYAVGGSNESSVLKAINKSNSLADLNSITDELINKIRYQKKQFELITNELNKREELAKRIPAIVPMNGVFSDHGFGIRLHPILRVWKFHEGIDINGLYGTPVYATGAGVVKFAGWNGGLGITVIIDHGFGYETTYGHLAKATVREGQFVKRFQKIGECGSTGLSTGPHLHYEVSLNGVKQNPVYYFLR